MDTYKGARPTWTESGLQLLFFPVIPMGPITRVGNFRESHPTDYEEILKRVCAGFFMLVLAAWVSKGVVAPELVTVEEITRSQFLFGGICLSLKIYWEFAGYSHLVIGLCLLCGIRVPENFNLPYIALNITDFWRRWHMSLSFWIRDYLYISLGGNRRGFLAKLLNPMLCMTVCGLWHGLTWGFFIWGVLHGILLAVHATMRHFKWRMFSSLPPFFEKGLAGGFTFMWVTLGWYFFSYKPGSVFDALVWLFQ